MKAYTVEELDLFELLARDNLADYDPLEYLAVVKASLEAGRIHKYSLSEVQNIEENVREAFFSLSSAELSEYQGVVHQMFNDITALQNTLPYLHQFVEEKGDTLEEASSLLNEIVDNYGDYKPVGDIETIQYDLAAGKLQEYSLPQLEQVEEKVRKAYSFLSNEERINQEDLVHQVLADLVDLQNTAEAKEYIGTVREELALGRCDNYDFCEITDRKSRLDQAFALLPGAQAEKRQIYSALDAAYNKGKSGRALNDLTVTSKRLAGGEFDRSTLKELERVEKQLQNAFSVIPKEKKREVGKIYSQASKTLRNLKEEKAESALASMLNDYALENQKEPQSWAGVKIGTSVPPQVEIILEDHEIVPLPGVDLFEIVNETRKSGPKPVTYDYGPKVIIRYDLLEKKKLVPAAVAEPAEELSPAALETIVAASKPLSKTSRSLAKAAFLIGGISLLGAGVTLGYNYLAFSVKDVVAEDSHRSTPSAEVVAPVHEATQTEIDVEANSVKAGAVPSPIIVAPQPSPAPRAQKAVKRYPSSWEPYDDNHLRAIEPGDTLGGLYEDYAARGGTLSRADYIKTVLSANPHLENANTIYAGQQIILSH